MEDLQLMSNLEMSPGRRVEIAEIGEGTIVKVEENAVEVAVSELETVHVRPDQLMARE